MSTKLFDCGVGITFMCLAASGAIGCKDKKADAPEAPAAESSESPIKKGAQDVGEGAGDAWKGMKTAGEKIGEGTATAAKDVASGTKKAADDVGEGVSEGVKKADGKSDDKPE